MTSSRRVNVIMNHLAAKEDVSILHHHGKGDVRIVKVYRNQYPGLHEIKQFAVSTILVGPVYEAFTDGDNSGIIATDTQKNTIYVLGRRHSFRSAEEFAMIIAKHFVSTYPKVVHVCKVTIIEDHWQRVYVANSKGAVTAHHHAFQKVGPHQGYAHAEAKRGADHVITISLSSGVRKLTVLKTTQSSFANFIRDEYTLLPDVKDRLLATAMDSTWDYSPEFINSNTNWEAVTAKVTKELIYVFCGPADIGQHSKSVQETAYQMGCKVLDVVKGINRITLYLPNIHNIPLDFSKLGLENKDHTGNPDVFTPTSEPNGIIQVTVDRKEVEGKSDDIPSPISPNARPHSGKSQITTHVLDTSVGSPAQGIRCTLQKPTGNGWATISSGITNADGRVSNLLAGGELLTPGIYRMHFETGPYYKARKVSTFYPETSVVFETFDTEHYHVPLLLNPFGYSTYRGS